MRTPAPPVLKALVAAVLLVLGQPLEAAGRPDVLRRLTKAVVAWHESMPADAGASYRRPTGW